MGLIAGIGGGILFVLWIFGLFVGMGIGLALVFILVLTLISLIDWLLEG